ncbi:MAG: LacI family DNA-binding transcriptional regulator [Spirochaetales bacterium]
MKELSENSITPVVQGSTIYDVAEVAAVSITTVSRFLNSPEKVNAQTSRKIREAIDKLSYIPHGNTGSKSKRQVGRIGVITPFFPAPSFVQRLQGMTAVLRQHHCELVIYTVDSPEQLDEYLHSIPFAKRLDGVIIMSMQIDPAASSRLDRAGLPVVLVEQSHPSFSGVECDNRLGGALAARHFLDKGYLPCGFVGEALVPPYSLRPSEVRWQGYEEALKQAGVLVAPQHVALGETTVDSGYALGRKLLDRADRPRALFAMSDLQAIGLLKAARELGLAVPGDVALLGFDDIEAAGWLGLSTVSQNLAESGRLAAELLMSRIREPQRPQQLIHLKVEVIPRSTT